MKSLTALRAEINKLHEAREHPEPGLHQPTALHHVLPTLILHMQCLMLWSKRLFGWSVLRLCVCVSQFMQISPFVSSLHLRVTHIRLCICVYTNIPTPKDKPSRGCGKKGFVDSQSQWFPFVLCSYLSYGKLLSWDATILVGAK